MGPVKPDGSINWNCPCMGDIVNGPCGEQFKAFFSCYHYSEAEPKGTDCMAQLKEMTDCLEEHPEIYDKYLRDNDKDKEKDEAETTENDKDSSVSEDNGVFSAQLFESDKSQNSVTKPTGIQVSENSG